MAGDMTCSPFAARQAFHERCCTGAHPIIGRILFSKAPKTPEARETEALAGRSDPARAGRRGADRPAAGGGSGVVRPGRAAGAGLGALTGLLGVGGGFLAVPALVKAPAFEVRAAVGTSLLVVTTTSPASLATRSGAAVSLDWTVVGLHRDRGAGCLGRQTPRHQDVRGRTAAPVRRGAAGRGRLHARRRGDLT
ncbi:hypothetical protein GCM10027162_52450 [Streptomyces incanus]